MGGKSNARTKNRCFALAVLTPRWFVVCVVVASFVPLLTAGRQSSPDADVVVVDEGIDG